MLTIFLNRIDNNKEQKSKLIKTTITRNCISNRQNTIKIISFLHTLK